MKNRIIKYIVLLTSVFCLGLHAQMEERGLTRDGNDFVKDSLFVMAEAEYLKSLDIHDFDTNRFNMAFAMLGQEKFDEAIEEWKSVEKTTDNKLLKSFCVYNIGGALVMQQKNEDAIEEYKQALRYFPKNEMARHNYWLLKVLKDQNPQQQQQDQDQNQDQNKDQENQDGGDQNKDQQNQDKDQSGDNSKDQNEDKSEGDNSDKESEDEKSEEEKNKDGESEDESKEDKSEEEKDKDGESEDESKENESEEDKSDQGDSEQDDEGKDEEGKNSGEQPVEGELSTGDALRLLESLDKEEDKTQEKVKAKLLKGKKSKKHEKDW